VPLRDHSGQLILSYDKSTGETTLIGRLLGWSEARWPIFARMGTILSEAGVLPFSKALVQGEQEVIFTWKIENEQMLKIALDEYAQMTKLSITMGIPNEDTQIDSMYKRRKTPALSSYYVENLFRSDSAYADHLNDFLTESIPLNSCDVKQQRNLLASVIFSGSFVFPRFKEYFYETLCAGHMEMQVQKINADLILSSAEKKLLLELLQEKDHINQLLWNVAQQGVLLPDADKVYAAASIYREYAKHGHRIPEVIFTISPWLRGASSELGQNAVLIFKNLVERGKCIQEASNAVKELILGLGYTQEIRNRGWELFAVLEAGGYKIPHLFENIKKKALNPVTDAATLGSLNQLLTLGYSIPEALQAAKIGLQNAPWSWDVGLSLCNLIETMVEQKQDGAPEVAIQVAKIISHDRDFKSEAWAWDWYKSLVSKGHAIPEAIEFAKEGAQDESAVIRYFAWSLFDTLVENGQKKNRMCDDLS